MASVHQRTAFVLALGLALLGGCVTTTEEHLAPDSIGEIVSASTTGSWVVREAGTAVGSLVKFMEESSGRFMYSVRDAHGLDLGLVDQEGRAWRFRPHARAEWVYTGTVLEGVGRILGRSDTLRLEQVTPEALSAQHSVPR